MIGRTVTVETVVGVKNFPTVLVARAVRERPMGAWHAVAPPGKGLRAYLFTRAAFSDAVMDDG